MNGLFALVGVCALLVGTWAGQVRSWLDASGKFVIQAELASFDGTSVQLKTPDGQVLTVPVERLSEADRQYLDLAAQRTAAFGGAEASVGGGASTATPQGQPAESPAESALLLRYQWKPEVTYQYKVHIEVDLGDEVFELSGTPQYKVISADPQKAVLAFQGGLMERTRVKESATRRGIPLPSSFRRLGPPVLPFSPMTGVGPFATIRPVHLTVDPRGNILKQEGTTRLPFLIGQSAELIFEVFPEMAQNQWAVSRGSGVIKRRGGFPYFGPMAERDEDFVPARENLVYTLESRSGDLVTIRKEYSFWAEAPEGQKPPFEIHGSGTYTFNAKEGVPQSLEFSMELTVREDGSAVNFPIKMHYHLMTEGERAALAKAAAEAEAERRRPLTEEERTKVLEKLRSSDGAQVAVAASQLAEKTPDAPDHEVAKALVEVLLRSRNDHARFNAARALKNWATASDVPDLIRALGDENALVRSAVIEALKRFKPETAIQPVAAQLKDPLCRMTASAFLKELGPAAERTVLTLLESDDPRVRQAAVDILNEIGSTLSIGTLEKAALDPDPVVRMRVKLALDAIKRRQ